MSALLYIRKKSKQNFMKKRNSQNWQKGEFQDGYCDLTFICVNPNYTSIVSIHTVSQCSIDLRTYEKWEECTFWEMLNIDMSTESNSLLTLNTSWFLYIFQNRSIISPAFLFSYILTFLSAKSAVLFHFAKFHSHASVRTTSEYCACK